MKYDNKFAISCDWLQMHVKFPTDFLERENPYYTFKRTGQSKIWGNIYEIRSIVLDNVVVHLCTDASECIMPKGHGILKFENYQLYCHDNLKEFVILFLKRLNFKFVGLTRFDIAFDFKKFYKDYDPQYFIKNFVQNKIIKLNAKDFGLKGKQQQNQLCFETLKFGSPHSNIGITLYNKTKELAVHKKPWIEAHHKDNFDDDGKDIWRLEFSLFSMTAFLKNEGKEFSFHSLECLDLVNIYGIFVGLFKKHFRFKVYSKKQKRNTRLKEVELWHFDYDATQLKMIKKNPLVRQSGRSDKTGFKWLQKHCNILGCDDENFKTACCEIFGKIASETAMRDWAKSQGIEFAGHEDYIQNIWEYKQIKGNEEKLDVAFNQAKTAAQEYFGKSHNR